MRNLAGVEDCDRYIRDELERAQIEIVEGDRCRGEVAATLTGKLGPFAFTRAWYYWVVNGPLPIEAARKLYAHPEGKRTVRVAGHCGCPPPEAPWVEWRAPDGRVVAKAAERAEFERMAKPGRWTMEKIDAEYIFSDDPESVGARGFVESYHIDDQAGLLLFADTVRAELAKERT